MLETNKIKIQRAFKKNAQNKQDVIERKLLFKLRNKMPNIAKRKKFALINIKYALFISLFIFR